MKRSIERGVDFDVTPDAERRWLDVLKSKELADDTFLRECTPGYYNEGKNQRDSIWLSNYGGGPFEYMQVSRDWLDGGMDRDFALKARKGAQAAAE